jgi:hypothetical protein
MATSRRKPSTKIATTATTATTTSPASRHEAVARRAYEIFLARGGAHGRDLDDWLLAERDTAARAAR